MPSLKPPMSKRSVEKRKAATIEQTEEKEKPGTSPVKSTPSKVSPKKKLSKLDDDEGLATNRKHELSPEEKAKRDQKIWEKALIAIDKLDVIEQPDF